MANDSISENAGDNSRAVCTSTSAAGFVKLPQINIKSFDGKPENWYKSIDSFQCATDKNETLPDIQKINY